MIVVHIDTEAEEHGNQDIINVRLQCNAIGENEQKVRGKSWKFKHFSFVGFSDLFVDSFTVC